MTRLILSLVLASLGAACAPDRSAPVAPTTPPSGLATSAGPAFTLSGVVVEVSPSGSRPVAGATLGGWIQTNQVGHGVQGGTTDAAGRYELSRLPESIVRLTATKPGYVQPCIATATLNADTVLDLELTSIQAPLPTRVSPLMITGVVMEVTPEGMKPVQGAEVSAQWFDAPIVTTVSDAQGRYLLCGLDRDPRALVESVWARKPGYRDVVRALTLSGRNAVLEIELARR